ncbi:hypothetical protein [Tenacibaculum maritimum]|uniref:hypothetical protein n=1 Tax=Tenacibaculum maritimum TaxID=107401 RepID=UPI00387765C4
MAKKTLLLVCTGVAFVSLAVFANNKKKQLTYIVDNLQFQLKSIHNIDVSFKAISMDVIVRVVNPTNENLVINTGFVKAKVLRVFEKKTGKLLAFSKLDTSKIHLPSTGFFDLPSVHLEIPSLTGAQYLLNQLNGKDTKKLLDDFSFELDITALGKTQTIKF